MSEFDEREYKRQWYLDNKDRLRAKGRENYLLHKDEYLARAEAWRLSHPKQYKRNMKRHRLKEYGITEEEYNAIFDQQGGRCAICGKHQSKLKRRLCIDHDHKTGKVRGLLCGHCNTSIGLMDENVQNIEYMIVYLKEVN